MSWNNVLPWDLFDKEKPVNPYGDVTDTVLMDPTRIPTHRCQTCGAFWIEYDDFWSLWSGYCGVECCDNVNTGSIRRLTDEEVESIKSWILKDKRIPHVQV